MVIGKVSHPYKARYANSTNLRYNSKAEDKQQSVHMHTALPDVTDLKIYTAYSAHTEADTAVPAGFQPDKRQKLVLFYVEFTNNSRIQGLTTGVVNTEIRGT